MLFIHIVDGSQLEALASAALLQAATSDTTALALKELIERPESETNTRSSNIAEIQQNNVCQSIIKDTRITRCVTLFFHMIFSGWL